HGTGPRPGNPRSSGLRAVRWSVRHAGKALYEECAIYSGLPMLTRRDFLRTSSAAALAGGRATPQAGRSKPNFIVILLDDLGCHDLGCLGASDLKTPNIDALAASGARFTNWYSNAPVCAPSRASLMTGRYPQRAG